MMGSFYFLSQIAKNKRKQVFGPYYLVRGKTRILPSRYFKSSASKAEDLLKRIRKCLQQQSPVFFAILILAGLNKNPYPCPLAILKLKTGSLTARISRTDLFAVFELKLADRPEVSCNLDRQIFCGQKKNEYYAHGSKSHTCVF
jgi:hypothetical protein